MVKQVICIAACWLLVSACNNKADGQDFFRQPATVAIEKNAAWEDFVSSDETSDMCKDFVLNDDDIKEFFRLARTATEREYSHDLLMSRCHAEGAITMAGNRAGKWKIDRTRRGMLILSNGQRYFFYCGKCQSKAYTEPCDIDCIHGK